MKQFTLITALFVLFASFRTTDTVKAELYNNKWHLKTIYSKDGAAYIYTNAFIRFDETKKQVGGNGSCNSFGGSVTINDDQLKFGALFSTKMYCDAVQQIETDFFAALGKVTRYEIKDNCLLLYQGEKLLLEFAVINDN